MSRRTASKIVEFRAGPVASARAGGTATPPQPLAHLLHRATQVADHRLAQLPTAREHGITSRQLVVMRAIDRNEGKSQVVLTLATGIDRSTLTDIIRRLVQRGWVSRRRGKADGRANEVHLTVRGRTVLGEVESGFATVDDQLIALLPAPLRKQFLEGLILLSSASVDDGR